MKIKVDVWNMVNGKDYHMIVNLTKDDIERIAMEKARSFFDYDAKYNGQVDEITPARISDELTNRVQMLTSAIYDILGCSGIIRVDYIVTAGEKINLLEVNTTPGMTTTSFIPQQVRAAGLDIKDVMTDIIENKF